MQVTSINFNFFLRLLLGILISANSGKTFRERKFLAFTSSRVDLHLTDIGTVTQFLVNAWKSNRICGPLAFTFRMQFT